MMPILNSRCDHSFPVAIFIQRITRIRAFHFDAEQNGERVTFRSYDGVPAVIAYSNGSYTHEPNLVSEFSLFRRTRPRSRRC